MNILPLDYEGKIPYKLIKVRFFLFFSEITGGIGDHVVEIKDDEDNLLYSYTTLIGILGCPSRIKGDPLYTQSDIGSYLYEFFASEDDINRVGPKLGTNYVEILMSEVGDSFFEGIYRLKLDMNSI